MIVKLNKIKHVLVQTDNLWADVVGIGEGLVTMVVGRTIFNNQIAR